VGTNRAPDVEARVLDVRSTGESVPAAIVVISFRNLSADHVEVQEYRMEWPEGRFTAAPRDLRIAPHGAIERTARLDPTHGDIPALLERSDLAKAQVLRARLIHH
jgi:hypothetical protein